MKQQELPGLLDMQASLLSYAVGRHSIASTQKDFLASITLPRVGRLGRRCWRKAGLFREGDVRIAALIGLPEQRIARQGASDGNFLGRPVDVGMPRPSAGLMSLRIQTDGPNMNRLFEG